MLTALGFQSGFTHMEWYRTADGEAVFGEIGARPPGARVVDLMNYATNGDLYLGWAEAVVHGRLSQPLERTYNVGSVFKRAVGAAASHALTDWSGCSPSTATRWPFSTCCRWARRGATGARASSGTAWSWSGIRN